MDGDGGSDIVKDGSNIGGKKSKDTRQGNERPSDGIHKVVITLWMIRLQQQY